MKKDAETQKHITNSPTRHNGALWSAVCPHIACRVKRLSNWRTAAYGFGLAPTQFTTRRNNRMLDLDDNRWKELDHRGWANGTRSELDLDAPFVPDELRILMAAPLDLDRFTTLWPYLCSECTTWPAAYAAAPYLVEIASKLSPSERYEYVVVVGQIATYASPQEIKPYLADSYRNALEKALPLLSETMLVSHNPTDTRYLLSAAAALKGHPELGEILASLDVFTECPECGAENFELSE
jgi:hypothetical protein